jgi:hypothetical protein
MSQQRSAMLRRVPDAIAIAMIVVSSTPAHAQQASQSAQRTYTSPCKPVLTPWPNVTPRVDRVTTTATTLDRQWLSDPRRGQADLTRLLSGSSTLLQYAVRNAAPCKGTSCACPRASKGSATTLSQTLDPSLARDAMTAYTRLYRQDSVATFTGAMLFLREHPDFVRHVADSLGRASTTTRAASRPAATTSARTRPPGA